MLVDTVCMSVVRLPPVRRTFLHVSHTVIAMIQFLVFV